MINHVFVYGTLRSGHRANSLLRRTAFVKTATLAGAELYNMGPFPALKLSDDDANQVVGELFELHPEDKETLGQLDFYEGCDPSRPNESMYTREVVEVGGVRAYTYVYNSSVHRYDKIESGDWNAH